MDFHTFPFIIIQNRAKEKGICVNFLEKVKKIYEYAAKQPSDRR